MAGRALGHLASAAGSKRQAQALQPVLAAAQPVASVAQVRATPPGVVPVQKAPLAGAAPATVPEAGITAVEAGEDAGGEARIAAATAALATKKAALEARRQQLAKRSAVQAASGGADTSAGMDEPPQDQFATCSDEDQLLNHLVEDVKIKPASALAYVRALIAQDFDVDLFHEVWVGSSGTHS